jgi:hypothetical protein
MATWTGLGDNTELFWAVVSHWSSCVSWRREPDLIPYFPCFPLLRRRSISSLLPHRRVHEHEVSTETPSCYRTQPSSCGRVWALWARQFARAAARPAVDWELAFEPCQPSFQVMLSSARAPPLVVLLSLFYYRAHAARSWCRRGCAISTHLRTCTRTHTPEGRDPALPVQPVHARMHVHSRARGIRTVQCCVADSILVGLSHRSAAVARHRRHPIHSRASMRTHAHACALTRSQVSHLTGAEASVSTSWSRSRRAEILTKAAPFFAQTKP